MPTKQPQPKTLQDLLQLSPQDIERTKIKFHQCNTLVNPKVYPIELYIKDKNLINNELLLWHTQRRLFEYCYLVICFVKISKDKWIMTTIKEITDFIDVQDGIGYIAKEVEKYQDYFGRVIVTHHKDYQSQVLWFSSRINDLLMDTILDQPFDGTNYAWKKV